MGERMSNLSVAVESEEIALQPMESVEKQTETETDVDRQELGITEEVQLPTYEEVVAEVEAYFGSTVYTFKSYKGTATQIAEQCPMARMAFMRGTTFAISFIETFGVAEEEVKLAEEETGDDDTDEPKDNTVPTLDTQPTAEKAPEKTAEVKADAAIAKTIVAQVAISAVMQERTDLVEYKPVPVAVEVPIVEKARVAEKVEPSREVVIREIEDTPLPLPVQKTEVRQRRTRRSQNKKMEQRKVEPQVENIETVAHEAESPIVTEIHEQALSVEQEVIAKEQPAEIEITEDPVVPEQIEQQHEANDFRDAPKIEPERASLETTIEVVDEVTVQDETKDEVEEPERATDLYETIADELGIEQDQPTVVEAIEDQTELETKTIAPLLEIIEEIADQSEEKQPVIKQRLVEVVRSIEILKWARSAEECKEAVDSLKTNLTLLLEELGYDEPELLTIQLLEQYNIQSIDEIMNTALKIARSKKSHSPRLVHIRQLLIGQHVVKLLIGTLSNNPLSQYASI